MNENDAILLTGYLGGAVATHVRVEAEKFTFLMPVAFAGMNLTSVTQAAKAQLKRALADAAVRSDDAYRSQYFVTEKPDHERGDKFLGIVEERIK